MSTADFVFIESKDPIFLDLQAFCTALREKFPGILIREGRILKSLLAFLGLSKSSAYLGKFFE